MVWYQVRGDRTRRGNRPQGQRGDGQRREGGQQRPEGQQRADGQKHDGPRREGQRPDGDNRHRHKGGKGKFQGKRDGDDRQNRPKGEPFASARPPRRETPVDPNSPFAKLAALKEQMKK